MSLYLGKALVQYLNVSYCCEDYKQLNLEHEGAVVAG